MNKALHDDSKRAKILKQTKCLRLGKWLNKSWCVHILDYYIPLKIYILLSEKYIYI